MITAPIGGSATEAIAVLYVLGRSRPGCLLSRQDLLGLAEPIEGAEAARRHTAIVGSRSCTCTERSSEPSTITTGRKVENKGAGAADVAFVGFRAFEAALQRSNQVRILDSCWLSCRAERLHAFCTANVPTPPDAPMISTFCPARAFPRSRRPCRAASRTWRPRRLLEGEVRRLGCSACPRERARTRRTSPWRCRTLRRQAGTWSRRCRRPPPHRQRPHLERGSWEPVPRETYRVRQAGHDVPHAFRGRK